MSASPKRRILLYYLSLPLVIAVLFALAAKLVAMHRAVIIADLSDRIAHHDTEEAVLAIRQLSQMPSPPAAVLVSAATLSDRKVARQAQQAIDRILRQSQQALEGSNDSKAVARQLSEIVAAIEADRNAFATADRPWLVSVTQRILRIANQLPPRHTPLIASQCDAVLAELAAQESLSAPVQANIQHGDALVIDTAELEALLSDSGDEAAESVIPMEEVPQELSNRPWTPPVFRPSPATTTGDQSRGIWKSSNNSSGPIRVPTQRSDHAKLEDPFAKVDSSTLMHRWINATGSEAESIERALTTERRFGRLSRELVGLYTSNQPQERLRLTELVTATPGVNSRPWLLMLADDSQADVRLAAVTLMATSTDPILVEKAWQTAIRDKDPRVAKLAGRLRERRSEIQRR